ncbi:methyltransferase domain-containing protein, partial [Patescibacteria group bacterium]|nr:methyltransferase domain-containing protein [Patescibacteria group bacterium]
SVGLSHAAEKITLANFDVEEGGRFPFKDNFFDVITMLAVFEHIEPEKIAAVLAEIKRMLKPGGVFIMTTPCPWSDKLLRYMARLGLVSAVEIAEHKGAYGQGDIASYLKQGGFDSVKMQFGYFEFFLNNWAIAKK